MRKIYIQKFNKLQHIQWCDQIQKSLIWNLLGINSEPRTKVFRLSAQIQRPCITPPFHLRGRFNPQKCESIKYSVWWGK